MVSWLRGILWLLLALPAVSGAASEPWAEASVSQSECYQGQYLVYAIRLFSPQMLSAVDVELPTQNAIHLEPLGAPRVTTDQRDGSRYVVTEYRYLLNALVSGAMNIAPTRVQITWQEDVWRNPWGYSPQASTRQRSADVTSNPVRLQVDPPAPGVRPWLALTRLQTDAQWQRPDTVKVGEPITLTLTLTGWGAKGDQLPSLESALHGDGFRLYPERPETGWQIADDGQTVVGWRREIYTLVPVKPGDIEVPDLQVAWWDLNRNAETYSRIPLGGIWAEGEAAPAEPVGIASPLTEHALAYYWLPLVGTLILGFALGARLAPRLREPLAHSLDTVAHGSAELLQPVRSLGQGGRGAVASVRTWTRSKIAQAVELVAGRLLRPVLARMPVSWRLRAWLRRIRFADEAPRVAVLVQGLAVDMLRVAPNTALGQVAAGLGDARLAELLRELEVAVYAGQSIELRRWKRDFSSALRKLLRKRRSAQRRLRAQLPALNP